MRTGGRMAPTVSFQLTPPRGGDLDPFAIGPCGEPFQLTPPRGGDAETVGRDELVHRFQLTPPRGGDISIPPHKI